MSRVYDNRKCCKKDIQDCRSQQDFMNYAIGRQGTMQRQDGETKVYGPDLDRGYTVLNCNHDGDLATSTRSALVKAFIAIGLGVMIIGLPVILQIMY